MKKLVTIRKAPDGKGKYVNKTAKFLNKAQKGMQTGYDEKLLEYVAEEILQNQQDPQTVYQHLIESKIDEQTALNHIQAILQYQQQQMMEQQAGAPDQTTNQDTAYSDAADQVEQDLSSNYGYYNPSGVGTELANDDSADEINAEADQEVDDMVMGDDAEYTAQDGGYIDDYIVNNYIPNHLDSESDDLLALQFSNGGAKNKRSFIRNVMSELKKAREGMQQEQQDPSEQFDMTDTLTLDRGKKKSKFVEGLARVTQNAKDKEKAEQAWQQQQMMQQQGQPMPPMQMPMGQDGGQQPLTDTEHPYHHLAMMQQANQEIMGNNMNATFSAQSGMTMPSPREYRKMHRQVSRMLPNIYLDPNIKGSELSVHDTDWLGRAKEYDIKFQGNQGIMPGWGHGTLLLGLPGGANMGWGNGWNTSWGSNWNTVKGIVETQKVKREGIIRDINKQADPAPKGQNEVDKVVADQSTVVKDANGNPIISDGSNIQYNPSGTNMPIADQSGAPTMQVNNQSMGSGLNPNMGETYGDFQNRQYPGAIFEPGWSQGGWDKWKATWNGTNWVSPTGATYQMGGFADPQSGLTRFVYGGDENIFDNGMNTINTADPYFGRMYRKGGMPTFEGGGMWITKPDGTTAWLKDDGTIDKSKVMTDDEKKTYDESVLKGHKDYYDKNKNQFVNENEQQKLIDDAVNKRMEQYTRQFGNNMQQQQANYYNTYGQRYNPGYNYMPGYRSNGFLDQLFSANLAPNYLGTWSKLKGLETSNGMPFTGFDDKTHLTNLKVTKSGWLSGRPKEYELSFSKYIDPRTANNITLDPNKNSQIQSQDKKSDNKKVESSNTPGYEPGAYGPGLSGYNADSNGNKIPDYLEVPNPQDQSNSSVSGPENKSGVSTVQSNLSNSDNAKASSIQPNINTGSPSQGANVIQNIASGNNLNYQDTRNMIGSNPLQAKPQDRREPGSPQQGSDFIQNVASGNNLDYNTSRSTVGSTPLEAQNKMPASTYISNSPGANAERNFMNEIERLKNAQKMQGVINQFPGGVFPGFAYGGYMPEYMAYGGYLPTAEGGNNPVDYTMNPAFVGKSNLDLISTYDNMGPDTGLQPSSMWGDMNSFGFMPQGQQLKDESLKDCTDADKQDPKSKCYEGIKLNEKDPMSANPEALKKEMMDKQDIKAKFKNKDVKQYDTEAWLGFGNKLGSIFPWLKNQKEIAKLQRQKIDNKTSDNLYATNVAGDPYKKTGQTSVTGSTTGLDFARDEGQLQYGQTQKGGPLKEGGVTYMTADEVRRFMEQGGQIEFI